MSWLRKPEQLESTKGTEMQMGEEGMKLIKQYEGCQLKAYLDSVKVPTIGWGRIRHDDGTPVQLGEECTQEQADKWLVEDVEKEGSHYVRSWAGTLVTNQSHFDALSSFCYNRGAKRLRDLLAASHTQQECADNMLYYDWAGDTGNHLLGLQRRRRSERALYLGQDWKPFINWKASGAQ